MPVDLLGFGLAQSNKAEIFFFTVGNGPIGKLGSPSRFSSSDQDDHDVGGKDDSKNHWISHSLGYIGVNEVEIALKVK